MHDIYTKITASLAAVMLILALNACAAEPKPKALPLPQEIVMDFFYDEPCGTCDGTIEFYNLINETLGDGLKLYPQSINTYNVFEMAGNEAFKTVTDSYGISRDNLSFPLLILHGKVYAGMEQIGRNIEEAYLTAGEDIFTNGYVHNPLYATGLFERFNPDSQGATIVYFYRITCAECAETTPLIDALPASISAGGKDVPLEIIKINTRSGNGSEQVRAFFEAYGVPSEHQMVPIVFLTDEYLAGIESISEGLLDSLENGGGMGFSFPSED